MACVHRERTHFILQEMVRERPWLSAVHRSRVAPMWPAADQVSGPVRSRTLSAQVAGSVS